MNPRAVEITVVRDGVALAHVTLGPGSYTIGRTEQNAIVLPDVGVSRRHATLHIDHESVWIEDGGSGNGTWYRGQRVDRQILGDGDELTIDRFHLRFNTGPEPTAESHQLRFLHHPSGHAGCGQAGGNGAALWRRLHT